MTDGLTFENGKVYGDAYDGGKLVGKIELLAVGTAAGTGQTVYLRRDVGERYLAMRADAAKEGVILQPVSGYRANVKQTALFAKAMAAAPVRVAQLIAQGRVEEASKIRVVAVVGKASGYPLTAYPGYSNHQDGTAIDIWLYKPHVAYVLANKVADKPEDEARFLKTYTWLKSNALRYGFKQLPSEKWHWSTTGR